MFASNTLTSSLAKKHVRINFSALLAASGYTDLIIDITILALPIPMIKSLRLDLKRKLSVAGIFSLGFLYGSLLLRSYRIAC
jgi:hypothetical protein